MTIFSFFGRMSIKTRDNHVFLLWKDVYKDNRQGTIFFFFGRMSIKTIDNHVFLLWKDVHKDK